MGSDGSTEWRSAALADVVTSAVDGPFGSNLKTEHYVSVPGVRVVRLQNLGNGSFNDSDKAYIDRRHATSLAKHAVVAGDLLVASLGDESHPVARACQYPVGRPPAIVKADCFRLRFDHALADPGFVKHVLNCPSTRRGLAGLSQGVTRDRVNLSALKRFRVAFPEVREQRHIAEILDTVDETIRATGRVIAKLEQVEQGLLHDLLTRGIDKIGEIRDPDSRPTQLMETVIGLVPKAWTLSNVDTEFDVKPGITLGPERQPRSRASPYLRVANVYRRDIDLTDVALLQASLGERAAYSLRSGDLLIVEGHANPHEIGRCAIVTKPAAGLLYQNHLFRLRAKSMAPSFCELWLNSAFVRSYWQRTCASSSGLYTINSKQLRAMPVAVPSKTEQMAIVRASQTAAKQIQSERRSLRKLRQLQIGLMDDLLTGRVRVNVENELAA